MSNNVTDPIDLYKTVDSCWITTPGAGLFYAGTIEFKNSMSVILMCMLTSVVVGIQWYLFGYSLAFSSSGGKFIGDLKHGALVGTLDTVNPVAPKIPEQVFFLYQMMFAIVTPALLFGAIAERTRLIPYMVFLVLWSTLVYDVVAYWVWSSNGWLATWNMMEYAGGLPVHIVSGVSGLAAALMMGKRLSPSSMPHNLTHTALGTALLWMGWFGFNGGSSFELNGRAINSIISTYISGCFGGLTWIIYDYRLHQRITSLGFCSGVVAGLVCATPGAGFFAPYYAPIFGILGALGGNQACFLKAYFDYDDTLDAFAVHAVVGFIGSLLTGIFAEQRISGSDRYEGWVNGDFFAIVPQLVGCLVGTLWSFVMTALIIWGMAKVRIPWGREQVISLDMRMSKEDEIMGTDLSLMDDFTYTGKKGDFGNGI